jgi:hypothetical protein
MIGLVNLGLWLQKKYSMPPSAQPIQTAAEYWRLDKKGGWCGLEKQHMTGLPKTRKWIKHIIGKTRKLVI